MTRHSSRGPLGFTLVEMMTVVLIIVIVAGLILLGVAASRQSAHRAHCLSNLRQLGMGFKQYAMDTRVLPSVHTNIWAIVGSYVGQPFNATSDLAFAANRNDDIGNIYRCGSDDVRAAGKRACSYAPNAQDAPPDRLDLADEGNWRYSPWSTFKIDAAKMPVSDPNRRLVARAPEGSAPDTILLAECWNGTNQIDVTGYVRPPLFPLADYTGPAAKDVLGAVPDAGTYRIVLDQAVRAAALAQPVPVRRLYHRGQLSLFFTDLHAEQRDLAGTVTQSPRQVPNWTSTED